MISLQENSNHYFQRPDVSHVSVDSSTTSLTGYAGRVMLNKNRGHFVFNTAVGFISPKFEANDLGYVSYSDLVNAHIFASYRWNEPTNFYHNFGLSAATYLNYDFGGNRTAHGYWLGSYIFFSNLYGGNVSFTYNPETFNARRTRGGPLMLNPEIQAFDLNMNTDMREWWVLNAGGSIRTGENIKSKSIYTNLEFKIIPSLTVAIGPEFTFGSTHAQWIGNFEDPTAYETYGKRYMFAHLDQTTFAADIRADWIISPNLSLQIYLQPLISSGKYSDLKALKRRGTFEFVRFGEKGSSLTINTSDNGNIESYTVDPDSDGAAEPITINNPDFNYVSFRGNAVLRWEYLPGATIFLVWTQSREDIQPVGDFNFSKSMNHLMRMSSDNIFMVKISYRI
jgi:hypothetical protein